MFHNSVLLVILIMSFRGSKEVMATSSAWRKRRERRIRLEREEADFADKEQLVNRAPVRELRWLSQFRGAQLIETVGRELKKRLGEEWTK